MRKNKYSGTVGMKPKVQKGMWSFSKEEKNAYTKAMKEYKIKGFTADDWIGGSLAMGYHNVQMNVHKKGR